MKTQALKRMFRPTVALTAAALLLGALAAPAAASPPERHTHLIQISLLLASKSGPSDLADLPANTRTAIEDIRQFLPFKSYQLLDTGLVRTFRNAHTKLRGPGGSEFTAAIHLRPNAPPGKVMVNTFELIEKLRYDSPWRPPAAASDGGKEGEAPSAPKPSTQRVMSSSFSADVGQTVVVGSSRLNGGDQALVVLFTALP